MAMTTTLIMLMAEMRVMIALRRPMRMVVAIVMVIFQ